MELEIYNVMLIVWVAYTMLKDKFEWWFIQKKIDSLLCLYCLSFWTFLIYSKGDIVSAAKAAFVAYWYVKVQEFVKNKLRK